jgi:hypothetical protein
MHAQTVLPKINKTDHLTMVSFVLHLQYPNIKKRMVDTL